MNKYWLWRPEYSESQDDGREVQAYCPQDAAQRWAERDDARSADYTIVGGTDATIMVRDPAGMVTEWIVSGETVAVYHARIRAHNGER